MLSLPQKLLQTLLPYTCILCGNRSDRHQDLCQGCFKDLPAYHIGCQRCGKTLYIADQNAFCGACLTTPPPFQRTCILFRYTPPITRVLTRLKFYHHLTGARVMGELLAEKIRTEWYRHERLPDVMLPVPLHPKRLRQRGYNQTLEIAKPVTTLLSIPLWPAICTRLRHTLPQTALKARDRRKNVHHAFIVTEKITGLYLAVVEDVITTGSTVTAVCQALAHQGAARIDVWCVARGT